MDTRELLEERAKTHGSFHNHATVTQGMKGYMRLGDSYSKLDNVEKEAAEMIMHKLGRIAAGDPHFIDHWQDIVGYASLVVNKLELKLGEKSA